MRGIKIAIALSLIICNLSAAHAITAATLSKAISDAKIIAPGYKINAAIFPQTHEVIVSTYSNIASKDLVNDCKIDAVLIAKKVFETTSQMVRVKVRFYDLSQASYEEVTITKPEVTAFSSGAVRKEELLASLEVITKRNETPASATTTRTASALSGLGSGRQTSQEQMVVYRKNGIAFYYPKSWGAKDMSNEWGDFVELVNNKSSWMSIIFRLQDKDSAEQVASDEDRYFWRSHQRVPVREKSSLLIGPTKNIQAVVYYLVDKSNPSDPDRYEEHVYFGYKHRIYSISVRFCKRDKDSMNADLTSILNTLVRE